MNVSSTAKTVTLDRIPCTVTHQFEIYFYARPDPMTALDPPARTIADGITRSCGEDALRAYAPAFAARHPERVTHLVLCSCQSRGRLSGERTSEQVEEVEARIKMIALAWAEEHQAYRQFSALLHIPDATPQEKLAHTELLSRTTSPANVMGLIHGIAQMDLQDTC